MPCQGTAAHASTECAQFCGVPQFGQQDVGSLGSASTPVRACSAEEAKLKDPKKRPVVKEVYDEIIFWEPTDAFYERVKHTRVKKVTEQPNPLLPVYREQQELQHLLSARTIVAQERASMEQLGAQGL